MPVNNYPTDLTTQYESVGARAARRLRAYEANPVTKPKFLHCLRQFVHKYQAAPLFVIGLETETIISIVEPWGKTEAASILADFRLPYSTMVLDFPKGLDPRNPDDPCVIFVDTLSDGRYYIETLRTSEAHLLRTRLMPESARTLVETILLSEGQEVGEASAIILEIDPSVPDNTNILFSAEYIKDCPRPVAPDYRVPGYCTFSACAPKGACTSKTPICQNKSQSADYTIAMLCVVLSYINRPDRYLVKVTPEKTDREKRLAAKGRTLSFAKKELHIVLDHSQIKEILSAASGGFTHASPLPHQRRGHWRELRTDRFKEKGPVWVRPADINKGMKVVLKKSVYEVVS